MEDQFAHPQAAHSPLNGQAIEGQYIIVFHNSSINQNPSGSTQSFAINKVAVAKMRERAIAASAIKATDVRQVFEGAVNGFAAQLSGEQIASLRQNPDVAYIEQDRIIALAPNHKDTNGSKDGKTQPTGGTSGKSKPLPQPTPTEPTPSDPTPTQLIPKYSVITPLPGETVPWNVERIGYGDGTGRTVWVIDSGIDTDHPDLNVDVSRSFSFIYGTPSIEDGFGHGTKVAGIIAAKNNGSGMIGVAANATVIALRVFDDAGAGTVSRAISAVNYVIRNGKAGDVVNMSLGSGISTTLDNTVTSAAANGILFSIAAGNSSVDCSGSSPARVNAPGVYTISAIDRYNNLWASSNFGMGVDFAAPGVGVTTTNINGSFSSGPTGTSYAAPHVAGILLLRGTDILIQGFITGDKDSSPDPIASAK